MSPPVRGSAASRPVPQGQNRPSDSPPDSSPPSSPSAPEAPTPQVSPPPLASIKAAPSRAWPRPSSIEALTSPLFSSLLPRHVFAAAAAAVGRRLSSTYQKTESPRTSLSSIQGERFPPRDSLAGRQICGPCGGGRSIKPERGEARAPAEGQRNGEVGRRSDGGVRAVGPQPEGRSRRRVRGQRGEAGRAQQDDARVRAVGGGPWRRGPGAREGAVAGRQPLQHLQRHPPVARRAEQPPHQAPPLHHLPLRPPIQVSSQPSLSLSSLSPSQLSPLLCFRFFFSCAVSCVQSCYTGCITALILVMVSAEVLYFCIHSWH